MDYPHHEGNPEPIPTLVGLPVSIEIAGGKQPHGDAILGDVGQISIVEEQNHQAHSTNVQENVLLLEQNPDPDRTMQTPKSQVCSASNTLCPHCKSFHTSPSSIMRDSEDISEDTITQQIKNEGYQCPCEFANDSFEEIRTVRLENSKHVTNWKKPKEHDCEVLKTISRSSKGLKDKIRKIKKSEFMREKEKEDQDIDSSPTTLLSAEEKKKAKEKEKERKKKEKQRNNAMEDALSREDKVNCTQVSYEVISTMERNEHILRHVILSEKKENQMLTEHKHMLQGKVVSQHKENQVQRAGENFLLHVNASQAKQIQELSANNQILLDMIASKAKQIQELLANNQISQDKTASQAKQIQELLANNQILQDKIASQAKQIQELLANN